MGDSETEGFWSEFIASLKERGLTGVRLVVSRQLPTDVAGHPKANAQRNFPDPASHILKRR
ncbi:MULTISPECIES: transposase [unclassified Cyanobium]|uniref:transposase n=1 Tax=unclassified Cyanobium TaxID=2627006 RepID=UPI0037C0BE91